MATILRERCSNSLGGTDGWKLTAGNGTIRWRHSTLFDAEQQEHGSFTVPSAVFKKFWEELHAGEMTGEGAVCEGQDGKILASMGGHKIAVFTFIPATPGMVGWCGTIWRMPDFGAVLDLLS